jgi:CRISPR system Cascade subunit CasA
LESTFNLLKQPWLPVRRADRSFDHIRPADITSDIDSNPIVAIDWPRADFRVASFEFLIGLIATACPPADDEETWIEGWQKPPTSAALDAAFAPLAHAFDIDGPGPRFLQDVDELTDKTKRLETLLIEAPGENTLENNRALFIKPNLIAQLSRPAAAMALFTLQCYAPGGGSGHRTSVRGGGPLTTLVLPGIYPFRLWHLIWANVPAGKPPAAADLPRIFPWLAPTRTADRFPVTTPKEAHPLQVFWGMPRRIRLDFAENPEGLRCDLTGVADNVIVTGWRQRKNGVKYVFWEHPLSATRRDANEEGWRAVQTPRGGIGYRDWVALVVGDAEGKYRRARCITDWWQTRSAEVPELLDSRLFAAGFEMDKQQIMKARGFVESEMPLPGTGLDLTDALAELERRLVAAAEIVASALRRAVRDALYSRDTKADSAPLAAVYEAFWRATHDRFFAFLREVQGDWETTLKALAPDWCRVLGRAALALFDETAPLDPTAASFDPTRIVKARRNLVFTVEGYDANGKRMFSELLLALPETKGKQPRRRKRGRAA